MYCRFGTFICQIMGVYAGRGGVGKGLVTITAEYEGEQYELFVRVSEK